VNPYVLLPEEVLLALFKESKKDKGPIPVKGILNGKEFVQTLVKYQGVWRLYLNGIMRKAAGIDVGDIAHVAIAFDPSSREVAMHPQFKEALEKYPHAKKEFESYPPYRQKEINRYINNLKSEDTRTKIIEKFVQHLLGKKVPYHVLLRNKS
jgi:uncharacterized protein YdeI (YjbR/CyaY-like superfamily)